MFITYKAKRPGACYSGTYYFNDGETKEVSDKEGERLLRDFPDQFSRVEEEEIPPIPDGPAPDLVRDGEKMQQAPLDKSLRPGRNKGRR